MTAAIERPWARGPGERDLFLILTGLVWVGILSGFGVDIAHSGFSYPLIVHFHAAAFVGWLVLFTAQIALVRSGRLALHRRLGVAGLALAVVMLVLGPATAIHMDALDYAAKGETPAFLSVQFTDMIAFAGLTGAALLLRRRPEAHKRLMMLGTLYISDAGFARWLGTFAAGLAGKGCLGLFVGLYLFSDLLVLSLGAYDLIVRRRLYPAYLAGAAWVLANQLTGSLLLGSPIWAAVSMKLIGR